MEFKSKVDIPSSGGKVLGMNSQPLNRVNGSTNKFSGQNKNAPLIKSKRLQSFNRNQSNSKSHVKNIYRQIPSSDFSKKPLQYGPSKENSQVKKKRAITVDENNPYGIFDDEDSVDKNEKKDKKDKFSVDSNTKGSIFSMYGTSENNENGIKPITKTPKPMTNTSWKTPPTKLYTSPSASTNKMAIPKSNKILSPISNGNKVLTSNKKSPLSSISNGNKPMLSLSKNNSMSPISRFKSDTSPTISISYRSPTLSKVSKNLNTYSKKGLSIGKNLMQPKKSKLFYDYPSEKLNKIQNDASKVTSVKSPVSENKKVKLDLEEKENEPVSSININGNNDHKSSPHLLGFPNYGNTCYLNSVLQSLVGILPFTSDYLNFCKKIEMNSTSVSLDFKDIISSRNSSNLFDLHKGLRSIKETLGKTDTSFVGYKMQDANEFLMRVLDTIKDEFDGYLNAGADESDLSEASICATAAAESLSPKPSDSDSNKAQKSEIQLENPVKSNFEFQLTESYQCDGCNNIELKQQEYFTLFTNFISKCENKENESIQDAINNYMTPDIRELTCEKCGHKESNVRTHFTSLPRILIIQLKRYQFNHENFESCKLSSEIKINKWIDLKSHLTEKILHPIWTPCKVRDVEDVNNRSNKKINNNNENNILKPSSSRTARNLFSKDFESPKKFNSFSGTFNLKGGNCQEKTPTKSNNNNQSEPSIFDNEKNFDLQEALNLSMREVNQSDDAFGSEDKDYQAAIQLSLKEANMNYAKLELFDNDNNNDAFVTNDDLDVSNEKDSYRLVSIISHFGESVHTGHYVSDVYNHNLDQWFNYNDEDVTQIPEAAIYSEGRRKNGYIFFYLHKNLFERLKILHEEKSKAETSS